MTISISSNVNFASAVRSIAASEQGAEIQKSSAEAMIDPQILQNSFAEALQAIEEVSNYKQQSLPKMKETIMMFSNMADEGQKVVDKLETGNKDLIE